MAGELYDFFGPWQWKSTAQRLGSELRAEEFTFSSRHVEELTDALWQKVSGGLLKFWPGAGRALQAGDEWDLLRELKSAVIAVLEFFRLLCHT